MVLSNALFSPESVETAHLEQLVIQYPWCALARALVTSRRGVEFLEVSMPYPTLLLPALEYEARDVVEQFLENPPERIMPPQEYDYDDISISSIEPDDEIATETLAQIYLAQGFTEQAKEIYLKLSLKNPEKSIYFADLINKITTQ